MAAFECRSETDTILTTATFDSKQMNWAALGEFVLAVLTTQMDVFNRLLGTTEINLRQFGWALVPAVALLVTLGTRQAHRSAGHSGCRSAAPQLIGSTCCRRRVDERTPQTGLTSRCARWVRRSGSVRLSPVLVRTAWLPLVNSDASVSADLHAVALRHHTFTQP